MFQRIQDFPLGQHFPHSTFLTHQGPWDTTDDPHIHCLQMICAIWGGKLLYNFNIFQSSGVSWVCSLLVNEEQDFSVCCPCLALQLHNKLIKSGRNHPWIGICCVFGLECFLHFWSSGGLLYLSITNAISVAIWQNSDRLLWFCSTMARITLLGWRL